MKIFWGFFDFSAELDFGLSMEAFSQFSCLVQAENKDNALGKFRKLIIKYIVKNEPYNVSRIEIRLNHIINADSLMEDGVMSQIDSTFSDHEALKIKDMKLKDFSPVIDNPEAEMFLIYDPDKEITNDNSPVFFKINK
jgi:hypothetical protein